MKILNLHSAVTDDRLWCTRSTALHLLYRLLANLSSCYLFAFHSSVVTAQHKSAASLLNHPSHTHTAIALHNEQQIYHLVDFNNWLHIWLDTWIWNRAKKEMSITWSSFTYTANFQFAVHLLQKDGVDDLCQYSRHPVFNCWVRKVAEITNY